MLKDILNIVLPVFLVIGLGFGLRRGGLIDTVFISSVNRLVYYVSLPLLLFYKISIADFSASFNPALVGGSIAVTVLGFIVVYWFAGVMQLPGPARGVTAQGACRGNLAYMGLALAFNAYGEEGLTRASVLMGFLVPVYNLGSILVLTLSRDRARQPRGGTWLSQFLLNPLILASALGIIWSIYHLPLPLLFRRALDIATGMTLPLALFAIGGSFSIRRLQGDLKLATLVSFCKLLLIPLLTGLLLLLLGVHGLDFAVGILLAGAPAATANYIMATELKGDAELAGTIVMLSTLLSALSYALLLLGLQLLGGGK
ncbi:MAG TPA: AEC family transporter [Gammaproteobacteria bacterium]|nr:AEC family transporter [Gammaproteobacteria bacterium]